MDTFLRYFGNNYGNHVSVDDAYTYAFSYSQWTRRPNLFRAGLAVPSLSKAAPEETVLLSNYPNPFNPETWILYQLSTSADVTVAIHDIQGRVVGVLDFGHQFAGLYESKNRAAYWDSRNSLGEPVASGVYFYTLTVSGDFAATRKLLIRK